MIVSSRFERGHDVLQRAGVAGQTLIIPFESGSRYHRLNASGLAAKTLAAGRTQVVVPPFTSNAMDTVYGLPINDETTSNPGSHDDAEYHLSSREFFLNDTQIGFSNGKTIGIICNFDRKTQEAVLARLCRYSALTPPTHFLHRPEKPGRDNSQSVLQSD